MGRRAASRPVEGPSEVRDQVVDRPRSRPTGERAPDRPRAATPPPTGASSRPGTSISDSTPPSDSARVKRRVASADRRRPRSGGGPPGRAGAGRGHERHHPAEARVVDHGDVAARPEERRDRRPVPAVPLHAQVQRPEPPQDEEAVERPRDGAHRVLEEPQPLGDRVVRGDGHADDRVGVAGEVLGRRVEHDVGADRQRPLQRRRRERVVDDDQRPTAALRRPAARRRPRRAAMSTTFNCGFDGVSNQTSRVRSVSASQSTSGSAGEIDVPRRRPRSSTDPLEIAERAAIDVVADDDLVARRGELGDAPRSPPTRRRRRCRGRRPRAPRPRVRAARAWGSASARTRTRRRGRPTPSWAYVEVW